MAGGSVEDSRVRDVRQDRPAALHPNPVLRSWGGPVVPASERGERPLSQVVLRVRDQQGPSDALIGALLLDPLDRDSHRLVPVQLLTLGTQAAP